MSQVRWPVEDMRKWYENEGLSVTEIAHRLEECPKAVWKVCNRNGFEMRQSGPRLGERHPGWKGGRIVDKNGYILVYSPGTPGANRNGYIREHRLVMSQIVGRPLLPKEVVHHKDGNKQNNDPSNLELFQSNAAHLAATLSGQCPRWTESGRAGMRAEAERRRIRLPSAEQLAEAYRTKTAAQIAKELGCSAGVVEKAIKQAGIPVLGFAERMAERRNIPYEEYAKLAAEMAPAQIAEKLGCKPGAVYAILKRLGIHDWPGKQHCSRPRQRKSTAHPQLASDVPGSP